LAKILAMNTENRGIGGAQKNQGICG